MWSHAGACGQNSLFFPLTGVFLRFFHCAVNMFSCSLLKADSNPRVHQPFPCDLSGSDAQSTSPRPLQRELQTWEEEMSRADRWLTRMDDLPHDSGKLARAEAHAGRAWPPLRATKLRVGWKVLKKQQHYFTRWKATFRAASQVAPETCQKRSHWEFSTRRRQRCCQTLLSDSETACFQLKLEE